MASTPTNVVRSISEEIECYSLPYGALGFASHVLTYYTILCLWFGRKPLWPLSRVDFSWFDLALGCIHISVSTILSIVAIVRCKDSWELLAIGVWKMTMSLLHGIAAIHFPRRIILERRGAKHDEREDLGSKHEGDQGGNDAFEEKSNELSGDVLADLEGGVAEKVEPPKKVALNPLAWISWWDALCTFKVGEPGTFAHWPTADVPGMAAGVVGLTALVAKDDKTHPGVLKLTAGFYAGAGAGGLVVVAGVLSLLIGSAKDRVTAQILVVGGVIWMVGVFNVLRTFYSDWVLGVMSGGIVGMPSGDRKVIYWLYWISERLPMFSW